MDSLIRTLVGTRIHAVTRDLVEVRSPGARLGTIHQCSDAYQATGWGDGLGNLTAQSQHGSFGLALDELITRYLATRAQDVRRPAKGRR